jgi:FAD-linked oxidoreductase
MALHWQNWSGYQSSSPQSRPEPKDVAELGHIIRTAPGPIRIVGTGHSFTPLVKSDGTIISLDRFDAVKSHDPAAMILTAGAGAKIGDLAKRLHAAGQAFPNMGDIDKQAFGGALGTATHGSGITLGAYHTQLEAVEIVDGRGQVRQFSRQKNADDLLSVIPGLGAFGAVTEVTIRNVPSYKLRRRRWVLPIEDMLDQFQTMMTGHRSAEFFYIPFSRMALFITSDLSDAPAEVRPADEDNDAVKTLATVQKLTSWTPWLRKAILKRAIEGIAKEDYVADWLNVYPSEREVRFNEMEYHLPVEAGPMALAEIIALLEAKFPYVYFPIEVRVVAPDDALLSPFYKRPTASIAIHHQAGADPMPYFNAMEPIFRKYGGRPHWGKMHSLNSKELEASYPRFKDAMTARRDLDPDNRFVSPYIASLFGIDA